MIYLGLSILFSTLLFVIFKYFDIYKVDILKAIVVNYMVAFSFGLLLSEKQFSVLEIPNQDWFYGILVLGALYISNFFIMILTTQENGISVASIAGKMSVVIPIFFGTVLYGESISVLKVIGILIILISAYLVSVKDERDTTKKVKLLFPVLLFLGSGIVDTLLKYLEVNFVSEGDTVIFCTTLFGIAACFGLIPLFFRYLKKKEKFGVKNVIAGIVLGISNYFLMIFLIKALQTEGFESSVLFTFNNIGIVLFSTLVGLLLFKEQFSFKNKIGIFLAVLGISILVFV